MNTTPSGDDRSMGSAYPASFTFDPADRVANWRPLVQWLLAIPHLAILNAFLPLMFGKPFLTTTILDQLPLPAGIHLTSTMLFETGIFLSVLGGSSIILETIAHPQEVETL